MNGFGLPGYLSDTYAESFRKVGTPLWLEHSQGWLLCRDIPGQGGLRDAMGLYPLFCCRDWKALRMDLQSLPDDLVSLVLVTDPLADADAPGLREVFDIVQPYKPSFVVDTRQDPDRFVNRSHRAHARRALRSVRVDQCFEPAQFLDEWMRLYEVLTARHGISGLRRFDRDQMAGQLGTEGLVMFRCSVGERTIGLDLWYLQDGTAHGHLAAFDHEAYRLHAAYASKWHVLQHFRDRACWINLGAGREADGSDGLSHFKRGFSTGMKPSWLCGKVLRPQDYAQLAERAATKDGPTSYFPRYRSGELA